jgi:hypothetical protein
MPTSLAHPSLGLVLWIGLALFASLLLHELGHAVAGALAGFRVVTCGVGLGRPLVAGRLFGVCFHWSRSVTLGLTVGVRERLEAPGGARVAFFSGGIVANLLSALVSFGLLRAGVRSSFLEVFGIVSLCQGLANALPFAFRSGEATLRTDGLLILDQLRGTAADALTPAERIRTFQVLREHCRALGALRGTVAYTLHLALAQIEAHEIAHAGETLGDPCLEDPARGGFAQGLEQVVRALFQSASGASDAEEAIDRALEACRDDRVATALLQLERARRSLARGEDAGAAVRAATESARAAKSADLVRYAGALAIATEPSADLLDAHRRLVALLGGHRGGQRTLAEALATIAGRLVAQGRIEEARAPFAEALSAMARAAADLPSEEGRRRYLSAACAPLREAAAKNDEGLPLFVAVPPAAPPRGLSRGRMVLLASAAGILTGLAMLGVSRWANDDDATSAALMDEYVAQSLTATVTTLEAEKAGRAARATDILEQRLDAEILYVTRDRDDALSGDELDALALARAWRSAEPRKTEHPEQDAAVRKALGLEAP